MRSANLRVLLGVLLVANAMCATLASSQTIVVDPRGAVSSISEAVRLVQPGGHILVKSGTYREPTIVITTPRVTVDGEAWPVLDGEGKRMAQRDIQVACLTAIGLSPLDINHDDKTVDDLKKIKAPEALASRQDQLRYLLSYMKDDSNNYLIRAHAPTAMGRLLATGEVPTDFAFRDVVAKTLIESLSKDSKDQDAMKQSAALALGAIGDSDEDPTDKEIRATLMKVKDDLSDQQVRNFALIALAQVSGRARHGKGAAFYIH